MCPPPLKCSAPELSDEDREHIRTLFDAQVASKLGRLHARQGVLNCGFAGEAFRPWQVRFRSAGTGFEIVEFEYDEEGDDTFDLDL